MAKYQISIYPGLSYKNGTVLGEVGSQQQARAFMKKYAVDSGKRYRWRNLKYELVFIGRKKNNGRYHILETIRYKMMDKKLTRYTGEKITWVM